MNIETEIDVVDREKYKKYVNKRREWLWLLNEDEHHAIWKQILAMIWDDVSFRILNESRKLIPNSSHTASRNGLLANFIDRGYILGQVIALRKLEEPNPKDKRKGVITLRRLLSDLDNHRNLLTREIYVAHGGFPYDYEVSERQWLEAQCAGASGGVSWSGRPTTGRHAFMTSRCRHEQFDRLSGVSSEKRSRDDCLSPSVLETLSRWIEESGAKNIILMGNKFLAHAADPASRATASLEEFGLTMNQIAIAHRAFVRITQVISDKILCDTYCVNVVPVPQYNPFENLDAPYVTTDYISKLSEYWEVYSTERDGWLEDIDDELARAPTEG